tara:strand:- start:7194 stop:7718 length:525 start_codon:yes stop_codon:yes gene_type:complete
MPTYPLSIPSELKVRSHYLRKQHAVGVSESPFDYEQQVYVHDGERYLLDLTFAPVSGAESSLTAWVTATAYVIGDQRSTGGVNYECLSNHTSGTFQTDYDAGNWKRIEIHAAIGFYQDIQGMEGTISINISGYDKSVSGDTSITFRLAKGGAPGYRQSINGIWEFDSLQLAEVV